MSMYLFPSGVTVGRLYFFPQMVVLIKEEVNLTSAVMKVSTASEAFCISCAQK